MDNSVLDGVSNGKKYTSETFFCSGLIEEQRQRRRLETFVPSEKALQENFDLLFQYTSPRTQIPLEEGKSSMEEEAGTSEDAVWGAGAQTERTTSEGSPRRASENTTRRSDCGSTGKVSAMHDVIRLLIPALYKNQSDSLMAADGDCHHLCKLMAPVRHRWSINDVIGGIRNTVMPSDCSPPRNDLTTGRRAKSAVVRRGSCARICFLGHVLWRREERRESDSGREGRNPENSGGAIFWTSVEISSIVLSRNYGLVIKAETQHGGGRRTSEEMVANVQAVYERRPRKSLRRALRELQVPKSTFQRIVHKRLKLYAYRVQLMQLLEPGDEPKRVEFANTMLDRLGADPHLTQLVFFLWGYVKDKVYAITVRDLRDLRECIIEAIESIPEDMFQRAWQEIVHRLDIVTVTAGAHVEI
ncbi:hypothetical protein ANN_25169 [Periplaneta americana]|uniref:Uncharacterized protein n=1 Tax=Periplaneta americana TaxID=6978 RepID=A0ABQ8S153_PERAM|nr:hypothetical protein ANN_25169 [Periplaneta americana]